MNVVSIDSLFSYWIAVFAISAYDKGGAVYAPSKKLLSLTLPEMDPMQFGSSWLWNHDQLYESNAMIHTIVCGAARPSDLDLPAVSAYLQATEPDAMLKKTRIVTERLEKAKEDALGKDWVDTCYTGILHSQDSNHAVSHSTLIWVYNMMQAFGLFEFAKNRYSSLEGNQAKWDNSLPRDENIEKLLPGWSWVPGLPAEEGVDYSDDFAGVPEANKQRVLQAEAFVRRWCAKDTNEEKKETDAESLAHDTAPLPPPAEWETAYDMRPWPDFPDRPQRT